MNSDVSFVIIRWPKGLDKDPTYLVYGQSEEESAKIRDWLERVEFVLSCLPTEHDGPEQ